MPPPARPQEKTSETRVKAARPMRDAGEAPPFAPAPPAPGERLELTVENLERENSGLKAELYELRQRTEATTASDEKQHVDQSDDEAPPPAPGRVPERIDEAPVTTWILEAQRLAAEKAAGPHVSPEAIASVARQLFEAFDYLESLRKGVQILEGEFAHGRDVLRDHFSGNVPPKLEGLFPYRELPELRQDAFHLESALNEAAAELLGLTRTESVSQVLPKLRRLADGGSK